MAMRGRRWKGGRQIRGSERCGKGGRPAAKAWLERSARKKKAGDEEAAAAVSARLIGGSEGRTWVELRPLASGHVTSQGFGMHKMWPPNQHPHSHLLTWRIQGFPCH